jgi:amylosucrase
LWKRLGTDSQNQPEAHLLVQAFRALTRLAAPGLALKAEAIVSPEMLVQYLGAHDRFRPECDLAYDNQLMVMLWSSLATRDVRLASSALSRRRRFLSDFYAGSFPGSFARGARFQDNPATGDARISGSAASLCGIQAALEARDGAALTAAVRRLESMYAIVFSFGGIPLIYMGDELALRNDPRWAQDPGHAHDNRWMHRPVMDWALADRRHDPESLEGQVFTAIRALAAARRSLLALRSGGRTEILPTQSPSVLAYQRVHPRSAPFLALTNFSDVTQWADAEIIARAGLAAPAHVHSTTGHLTISDGQFELPPWSFLWLTGS